MAESTILVPDSGTKKLHTFQRTIGANAVEDEVIIYGEQYLASYIFPSAAGITGGISTATANSHLCQVMAGASLKVRIRRIEVHQAVAATTAALMSLVLVRLTSAGTGGSALTFAPLDTTDSAAGASAMTLPTAKGTEATVVATARPYMMQTIGASAQLNQPIAVWDFDRPRTKPLIIPAGATQGIAVKNITAIAAGAVDILVWIDETSF